MKSAVLVAPGPMCLQNASSIADWFCGGTRPLLVSCGVAMPLIWLEQAFEPLMSSKILPARSYRPLLSESRLSFYDNSGTLPSTICIHHASPARMQPVTGLHGRDRKHFITILCASPLTWGDRRRWVRRIRLARERRTDNTWLLAVQGRAFRCMCERRCSHPASAAYTFRMCHLAGARYDRCSLLRVFDEINATLRSQRDSHPTASAFSLIHPRFSDLGSLHAFRFMPRIFIGSCRTSRKSSDFGRRQALYATPTVWQTSASSSVRCG